MGQRSVDNVGKRRDLGVLWQKETDPATGVSLIRLSSYKGHAHHLYFTNPGWYDGGRRLLFAADREDATNLCGLNLQTGETDQLTFFLPDEPAPDLLHMCVSGARQEAVFWRGKTLYALDLQSLEERPLWTLPHKRNTGMVNVTADGRYALFCMSEDLSDRIRLDLLHGYVGFAEMFAAKPFCQIMRIPMDGSGKAEAIHEGRVWMGHLNTSPTQEAHATFCHEGPWELVDNRMWALRTDTGETWALRPRKEAGERIGHEYWFADGERVGYHGAAGERSFLGSVRFDGGDEVEGAFPHHTTHVHSNDKSLAVGDGSVNGDIMLWRWLQGAYEAPRVLCAHRCSMHMQELHVHPRLSPDGRYVLFTSDKTGYGSPYLAELPGDLTALPFAQTQQ